jgi:CheY-like chemotaxis protein
MSASIIVVDDEPDVTELFRRRFRREARQGTHVMHFAGSGKEALELLSGEIDPGMIVRLSDHHARDGRPPAAGQDQRFAGLELKAQLPAAAG